MPGFPTKVRTGLSGERGLNFNVIRFAGGVVDRFLGGLLVLYRVSATEAALGSPRFPCVDAARALPKGGPVKICSPYCSMMLAASARNCRALFARP